ncbi:VCBS domain-containing protein [Mycobacterium sp. OAE908]|uniref:Ig-like domain-containing protein n=1 Tax=Mycobacterium sp. OAE908 TaxID=2817899 RepID=UPI001AE121AB
MATVAPAARMMTMSTASTTTAPALPTITLPPYPTVPGVSPTKVALAVFVVLGKALQTALSGPVPNPIAIPLYMLVIAAYQRLTELATNHVPVAGTPSTPLQLPTGTVVGDIGTATDPDGDPLTYTVTTPPTKGTVAFVGTSYVYTPNTLLSRDGGTDSFTVTIDDSGGAVDHPYAPNGHTTAETININYVGTGIDLPPVPTATQGPRDSIGVVRGGFTVVDLDDLTGAGRTFSLANGNSAGATATSAFTSLGGIVTLNQTTGDWTYVPAVSGNVLGIPTHTDTFVVTVDDGHPGGSVQTTVSVGADLGIAVTGTSTNPTTGAYSGSLNVPAGDNGLLTYSVGTGPSSKGSVFVTSTGGFIYTPTDAARHAAAKLTATDADKTDSFTIKGTDANGRSITVATVQVTISATNAVPTGTATFNSPGSNGVITGAVSVTDADNDTLAYSGTAGKGTVTFTGANFTYTPTLTARHAAAADGASTATKQDTVTINVSDGYGGVKTFTQTVDVTPQNTNPTYTSVSKSSSGLLNLTKTWTVNGMADADSDTLTLAVTSLPSGGLVNVPVVLGNTVTLVSLGTESGKTFVVTMSDGHGGNVPITLTI